MSLILLFQLDATFRRKQQFVYMVTARIMQHSSCSISSLPVELLSSILHYLAELHQPDHRDKSRLATYASVCRQWQALIETRTFRNLKLNLSNPNELADFQAIFALSRVRRGALANVLFEPVLPDYSVRSRRRYERGKDRQVNNVAFTDAIRNLFTILQSWEALDILEAYGSRPLCLQILPPYATMDRYHYPGGAYIDPLDFEVGSIGRGKRYIHSYLRLVGVDTDPLPVVRRIARLCITNGFGSRQTEPSSVVAIAKCLPSLERLELMLCDNEWRYPVMRRQHRLDFAHALTSFTLSATGTNLFSLSYGMSIPLDHSFPIPTALHASSPITDHLSIALFHLSQLPTLKEFILDLQSHIVISPSLFWPADTSTVTSNKPIWPALEYMDVSAHPTTPTGGWYFERDSVGETLQETPSQFSPPSPSNSSRPHTPNSTTSSQPDSPFSHSEREICGDYHLNLFRTKLCPTTFDPLALSFARAVTRMPKLRGFYFQIENVHPTKLVVEWARAGGYTGLELNDLVEFEHSRSVNRWIIGISGARWEVPDNVMEAFKEGVGLDGLVTIQQLGQ